MKDIAKRFCLIVRWINNSRNVIHDNFAIFLPILNNKILNIHVAGFLSGRCVFIDIRLTK